MALKGKYGHAPREIERKFLVRCLPPALTKRRKRCIEQGYLVTAPDGTQARLRRAGRSCWLTIKRGGGLSRLEWEIPLTASQFRKLWPATAGRRLQKIRYEVPCGDLIVEIDVYEGRNKGLIVAEVEFENLSQCRRFHPPAWLGREVSGQARYSNIRLARE